MATNSPTIDWDAAKQQADSVFNTIQSAGSDWGAPGFLTEAIAVTVGAAVLCASLILIVFMQVGIAIGSWVASTFLELLDTAKEENKDAINGVLANAVNEMLGTSLTADSLSSGSDQASSMDNNQSIGDAILSIFEQAFGATGPVSPQQGADNARKFAGWAVSFATSQGFLSILSEAASLGFLKEFHELPDAVREGLGLGRLQRLALQPLIQNAIQKPYTWKCNDTFRPTRLNEAQLVKALHSGNMQESDVRQQLSELGYADGIQDFLLTDFAIKLALAEQLTLLNNGDIQEQDVINNLTLTGMPEDQAKQQLKAAQYQEAKGEQDAHLSDIETAYVGGFIDQTTYNSELDKLPLSDQQLEAFRARVGFKQEIPRKTLSFADVKAAVISGIVDFGYLDTWMQREGYDSDAQNILTFQVMESMTKATEKRNYAAYKAQALQKKGKPVPPWITDAEKGT